MNPPARTNKIANTRKTTPDWARMPVNKPLFSLYLLVYSEGSPISIISFRLMLQYKDNIYIIKLNIT